MSVTRAGFEYDLGRSYRVFKAAIGQADISESSADVYRFRVYGDGSLLTSEDIGYGDHRILKANVANVLWLRLEVTKISRSR